MLLTVMFSVLFRIDLAKPDQLNQTELGRKDDSKVYKLFLDPTGKILKYIQIYYIKQVVQNNNLTTCCCKSILNPCTFFFFTFCPIKSTHDIFNWKFMQ